MFFDMIMIMKNNFDNNIKNKNNFNIKNNLNQILKNNLYENELYWIFI